MPALKLMLSFKSNKIFNPEYVREKIEKTIKKECDVDGSLVRLVDCEIVKPQTGDTPAQTVIKPPNKFNMPCIVIDRDRLLEDLPEEWKKQWSNNAGMLQMHGNATVSRRIFGVESLDLRQLSLPPGVIRYKISLRPAQYGVIFMRYSDRIEQCFLRRSGDSLLPGETIGANYTKK